MRVELPSPQLRDPGDGTVGHDNFLDAIDPSSLSEVDARLMETADRFIGVDAHLVMVRATTLTEQPRPWTEYSCAEQSCVGRRSTMSVSRRWFTVAVTPVDVFAGEICGVGSMLGVRVVIGRWPVSPFGPVADAMVEDAAGRRVFIAQDDALAAYVSSIYSFDDVIVGPVDCERSPDRLRFRGRRARKFLSQQSR